MASFRWRWSRLCGWPVESGLTACWAVLTAGGVAMSLWFFKHCQD